MSNDKDFFKEAFISLDDKIGSFSKQNTKIETLHKSLRENESEIKKVNEELKIISDKITSIENDIKRLYNVLLNHTSIINKIKTAISEEEQ